MALQTKTFTYGSYAYGGETRGYVFDLELTEESISSADNTSLLSFKLILKSGSSNRFTGQVDSVINFNGVTVASGSKQIYAAFNSSWVLLEGQAIVNHKSDGTLNMPVSVSITTYNSYAPPSGTHTETWNLTAIPRSSSISRANGVTLGDACSVQWIPNSSAFRYKLKFSLGSWAYTTAAIHPNRTGSHTYTDYVIPLEVAKQITGSKQGDMTVTLTTYSDSGCTVNIGSDSEEFKVTVPDNAETQPTVTMELTPAGTTLEGLYLQGQSKVQALLSAEGKLGASIKSYSMVVDGYSYEDPYLSNALTMVGDLEIIGSAVDSREITGYAKQTIQVHPYYIPRLKGVTAYRCTSEGVAAEDGEYLKIEATRDYAPVIADGAQRNFCKIQYRKKAEKAEGYSEPVTILEEDADKDSVITEPLLNATFSKEVAYTVQIIAVDTVGQSTTATVQIPSEAVFRHKRPGGKGLGLGGYCEEDDLLDVHWNQRVRKDLRVDGNFSISGKATLGKHPMKNMDAATKEYVDGAVGGAYIRTVRISGADKFRLQTEFTDFSGNNGSRQSIFLFGNDNHTLIYGVIGVANGGSVHWSGTGDVTLTADEAGVITVTLPFEAWDHFVLISAEYFSIINEEEI